MTKGFKTCAGVTALYLMFIYFTNIYYCDDLMRSYYGYMAWSTDGRPFADIFYKLFLQFGSESVPDIFPLPIIISGAIFSYAIYKALQRLCNPGIATYAGACIALLCNPFIISNFLFRYDGAFMMLAFACAIAPHAIRTNRKVLGVILSVALLTMSFGLYQASVNVFIGFSFIAFLSIYINTGDLKKCFSSSILDFISLVLAYLIYSKLILAVTPLNPYFVNFSKVIPLSGEGLSILIRNILQAIDTINVAFNSGLILPLAICSFISLYCLVKYAPYHKGLAILLYIVGLAGVSFFSFGIVAFGQNAAFFPRVFMGLGCLFAFNIIFTSLATKNKTLPLISSLVMSLPLLVIFFATLNASRQDYEYQNNIASMIVKDIYSSTAKKEVMISIEGNIKRSPVAQINSRIFPVIDMLLPQIFKTAYDGGRLTLIRNGLHEVKHVNQEEAGLYNSRASENNMLADNSVYSIYHVDNVIVIKFH